MLAARTLRIRSAMRIRLRSAEKAIGAIGRNLPNDGAGLTAHRPLIQATSIKTAPLPARQIGSSGNTWLTAQVTVGNKSQFVSARQLADSGFGACAFIHLCRRC